jgi:hypothetical protein
VTTDINLTFQKKVRVGVHEDAEVTMDINLTFQKKIWSRVC